MKTHPRYIDPVSDLGASLLNVEKPARYTGGEYGRLLTKKISPNDDGLKCLIAFPDLYEIGMSNQALRIIYNNLNRIEGVSCDRAFAPAPDFQQLLFDNGLPLFGLDTGISFNDLDLLMFTLGYELGITTILSMLDVSRIPFRLGERKEGDPIVIVGGPCTSNPLPYADFIDAFWIGEAEDGFFDLARELGELKKKGSCREQLLECLLAHPSVWASGKEKARRAVDARFSTRKDNHNVFPVPGMKVVHHHGAVEIMRGCPNACRFCHAGYWSRPMRQKDSALVIEEARAFIRQGGYREITLSSLSSGDYGHLDNLIDSLNEKFSPMRVSFQLPSLKVSTFSLQLLDKISRVRKSGLTFAVETPTDFWQMMINKTVSGEDIVSILKEARRQGWRLAKFYFMIGLPLGNETAEEEEIALFVEKAARQTGMRFNINVGTFVPKPHTPFQWAAQMDWEKAGKKLFYIKNRLKPQGHKVSLQDPFISVIEGITSRGDRRVGEILEEASRQGCRLDAWSEYFKRDTWLSLLEKHASLVAQILDEKSRETPLPWACIDSGLAESYFADECDKSRAGILTERCAEKCAKPCGACAGEKKIRPNLTQPEAVYQNSQKPNDISSPDQVFVKKQDPDTFRILFSYSKQKSAIFHPHLALLEIFSMAFIRAGIPVIYTQGFNPLAKLEIASPLSLGIKARGEIALIDTEISFEAAKFREELNAFLPEGFEITRAANVFIPRGSKKHSVSSLLWGYAYAGKDGNRDLIPAREEKAYRELRSGQSGIYGLERLEVLATKPDSNEAESYFKVYPALY